MAEAKPLSDAFLDLRNSLSAGEDPMPQTEVARMVGKSSPSTWSRIESGSLRPSDDYLQRVASAFPKQVSLEDLTRLRDRQWTEVPKRGRRKKSEVEAQAAAPAKKRGRKASAKTASASDSKESDTPPSKRRRSAKASSGTSNAEATPVIATPPAAAPKESAAASSRSDSGTLAPAASVGRSSAVLPPRKATAVAQRSHLSAVSGPETASSAPESAPREREASVTGQTSLIDELVPSLVGMSSSMEPALTMRYAIAVSTVLNRMIDMYADRGRMAAIDARAATMMFASDFWVLLTQGATELRDDMDEMHHLETLIRLIPSRSEAYDSLVNTVKRSFRGIPGTEHTDWEPTVRLSLLRALSVGAQRR